MTTLFRILCIGMLLAACGAPPLEDFPPTSTTVRALIAAPTARIAQALPESAPANADAAQALTDPCRAGIGLPMATHQIDATLDYAARALTIRQRIRVINQMGVDLSQINLNVEPNRYPETFTLRDLVGDSVVGYELTGRRLAIALHAPLAPGCASTLDLVFDLTLPPIGRGLRGFAGFFGYSSRQINLGHWLPTLAVFQEGRWVTHDAFSIGEQIFSEIADWDVTLTVTNAPPRTVLAAPGMVTPLEGSRWRVRLSSARDFAISVSPFFNVRSQVSSDGTVSRASSSTMSSSTQPGGGSIAQSKH